ncbi:MAG: hypothetical protein FJ267_17520 [Planctomycetes bacterium]|nr:hypothetical protein [Planctomycetota bacterium]
MLRSAEKLSEWLVLTDVVREALAGDVTEKVGCRESELVLWLEADGVAERDGDHDNDRLAEGESEPVTDGVVLQDFVGERDGLLLTEAEKVRMFVSDRDVDAEVVISLEALLVNDPAVYDAVEGDAVSEFALVGLPECDSETEPSLVRDSDADLESVCPGDKVKEIVSDPERTALGVGVAVLECVRDVDTGCDSEEDCVNV